jgi:chemotaxis family two-component system response regulator Rcp1
MKSLEVLLVEDNPGDVRLAKEAFEATNIAVHLGVATNGVEALAFLRREGVYANAPHSDLTLLDLNMPRKDGREVLAEIKKDEKLKTIPIVIFTTSESERDTAQSYQLQANCYLCKGWRRRFKLRPWPTPNLAHTMSLAEIAVKQLPSTQIYTRHSRKCAQAGTSSGGEESYKRCRCWKWLRWHQRSVNGKSELKRLPTKCRDWAGAERSRHDLLKRLEAKKSRHVVVAEAKNPA